MTKQTHDINPEQFNVLIVDHDPSARDDFRRLFEQEGYVIFEAESGQDAIDAFAQHRPHLVLLDMALPDMDAYETCATIRSLPGADLTPILAVANANAEDDATQRAFAAGATDFILKPTTNAIMLNRVRQWLRMGFVELELARYNRLLELLNEVSQAAASSLELDRILKEILRLTAHALQVTHALVYDYDEATNAAHILMDYVSQSGSIRDTLSESETFHQLEEDYFSRSPWLEDRFRGYRQVHFDDADLFQRERTVFNDYGVKSILMVPVYVDRKLFGYVEFWETKRRRTFNTEEIELTQAVASRIGTSIGNAQLYTALRQTEQAQRRIEHELIRRNRILEYVNHAARAASSSVELNEILQRIITVAADALQVTHSHIYHYSPADDTITVVAEYVAPFSPKTSSNSLGITYPLEDFPRIRDWIKNPDSSLIIHHDDARLSELERRYYHDHGMKSALAMPLYARGEKFGFLMLWEARHKRAYVPAEIDLVSNIANQVGSSISNARWYAALRQSEEEQRAFAEELAERNRELDAYSHTIAHDLKNPLQMVMNYALFVQEEAAEVLSPMAADFLHKIKLYSIEMADMIEQLLVLANLRHAQEAMLPVEIEPVLKVVRRRYEDLMSWQKIKFTAQPPLPPVLGHDAWVKEIFSNLISNAIKYMGTDNDDPQINVFASVEGDYVRYSVQDTGIGISPTAQERLFEMFSRVHESEEVAGSGLGLSIIKRLVSKMNGTVGIESEEGKGSIFWFTLPAVPQKPQDE